MVSKGNSAHAARMRRAPTDGDVAPVKLKKKVIAVRSDSLSSESSPTAERGRRENGPADWAERQPENPETSPSHGPRKHQEPSEPSEDASDDAARPQSDESQASALVAIAPAKPGTILPKDMVMAKYRVKPDAPKFLLMLFEILQHESNQVIRWTEDGLALQILDQANVTEKVLPKYFNHTNFHSFQRQLNYFGFRKWTKSKTDICTFSHPYFRRNQPELMHLIKRKKATRRTGATEQAEAAYPTEGYAGTSNAASPTATASTATGPPKKLLPLSPPGKRRLGHDGNESGETRVYIESSGSKSGSVAILPALSNNRDLHSASGHSLLPPAASLTSAISPASGGAKKKAKTTSGSKSYNQPELAPSGPVPPPTMLADPATLATIMIPPGAFPKGALPNLDLVRNRLIYRQPPSGATSGPIPSFPNGFPIAPNVNTQISPSAESKSQSTSNSATTGSNTSAPTTDSNSSMFNNSFSDPVDILLRIKKSRAMSQDNTLLQSPQQNQSQVEGFASLQNFLLSQSMYTNRLESQLKLAMEENEALRHLVDAKQREVEALLNERKMIQNENSVLTEDKNKLFEINRDLLSKLFPQ